MERYERTITAASEVFRRNRLGNGVITPEIEHFRGSFMWDTAIIANAQAGVWWHDAEHLIRSHLRGQRPNGMIGNEVIFQPRTPEQAAILGYQSQKNGVSSSAITQPPTLMHASRVVAQKLPADHQQDFLRSVFPKFVRYTQWLFDNRSDPDDGLFMLVHPDESGRDNSPDWDSALENAWENDSNLHLKDRAIKRLGPGFLHRYRIKNGDLKHANLDERSSDRRIIAGVLQLQDVLRNNNDAKQVLENGHSAVVKDVGFNALAAYALEDLLLMEKIIDDHRSRYEVPETLYERIMLQKRAIDQKLWSDELQSYCSIDVRTGEQVRVKTAAGLLPALTSHDKNKVTATFNLMTNPDAFWTATPIPSVAISDPTFDPRRYWRGPSWPFMRYYAFEALREHGQADTALELARRVLANLGNGEFSEYNDPNSGEPLGMHHFSPTAAEAIIYARYMRERGEDLSTGL